jgi:adenylate kinase family enzyme
LTRTMIAGVPRSGKTTLAVRIAARTCIPMRHSDDVIGLGWSEASEHVASWFAAPGPWVIEGVAVGRALRKWLAAHPTGKPCDVIIWLGTARVLLTPGQAAMGKGCETVWQEIKAEVVRRGVEVRYSG